LSALSRPSRTTSRPTVMKSASWRCIQRNGFL